MAFIKDLDRTKTDFATYELAAQVAKKLKTDLNDPKEEKFRIRIRARTRTGLWDVVVKVKKEEKAA